MSDFITAEHLSFISEGIPILTDCSFYIYKGECIALTGSSGSGKTTLGKIIAGHYPFSSGTLEFKDASIKKVFVHQQHDFRLAFQNRSYFGQRFDRNYAQSFPTVEELLYKQASSPESLEQIISLLQLQEKRSQPVIELSNGEGKRVQLAQALLLKPELLILDQPFIGLDEPTRALLHKQTAALKAEGITIIIITSEEEIPVCADRIFELSQGTLRTVHEAPSFKPVNTPLQKLTRNETAEMLFQQTEEVPFEIAVRMNNISVRFGETIILDRISWTVKRGERWALTGHNGSGKSTLLSLINADNPQVYQNDIILFDHKRGSGESIREIKHKIGYVSPELHAFFQRSSTYAESVSISANDYSLNSFSQDRTTCFEAVCSGLNDQIGSSAKISHRQRSYVLHWMQALDVESIKDKIFYTASLGEQRLLLLARALVKNPPLLILDEPCQGLDRKQIQRFTSVVDTVCRQSNKTLIYVSHYDRDMPSCINHYLTLEKGKVKECF